MVVDEKLSGKLRLKSPIPEPQSKSQVCEMKPTYHGKTASVLLAILCGWAISANAQEPLGADASVQQEAAKPGVAPRIPESRIAPLVAKLARRRDGESAVRRRLACKSLVRSAKALIEAFPAAPNRYHVRGIILKSQKELLRLEKTNRNRDALFETCSKLREAPDEYANLRLEADLLLSERKLTSQDATPHARVGALRTLLARYRDTSAEVKSLMIAAIIAQKLGDDDLQNDILQAMSERFAANPAVIEFRRARLENRVLAAPFHGTYTRADGTALCLPMDRVGESSLFYFWSSRDEGFEQRIAEWKTVQDECPGLLKIFSFNLDELPDAGEKILRKCGVDWAPMRLPGGRDSQTYRAYARRDPICVHISPTGYAALLPENYRGHRSPYTRRVKSYVQKNTRYLSQLQSLFIGEFLVVHPCEPFDPACPPELKAVSGNDSGERAGAALRRTAASVSEKELRAIQACFVVPPLRYRLTHEQARANYKKAESLCSAAIKRHAQAADLWIVRNRRIVALLGLWKLDSDPKYLKHAAEEAQKSLALKPPRGARIVPRFCLAKEALRRDDADPHSVLTAFIEATGGPQAPGAACAAAAILSLDGCAPYLHAKYRKTLIDKHAEDPMSWTALSFVLDRFHTYYLYLAPYYYGRIPGYRRARKLTTDRPEAATRVLKADLRTLDGQTVSLPKDQAGKWTIVLFMAPWQADAAKSRERFLHSAATIAKNPLHDIDVISAFLTDDVKKVSDLMRENPWKCRPVVVPDGIRNPIVNRLGMLSVDVQPNVVLLRPDGVIGAVLSGLTPSHVIFKAVQNSINVYDENAINKALKSGDLNQAKQLAFKKAPPDSDRKKISIPHLRARTRVYMAMKDWEAASADMVEVIRQQQRADSTAQIKSHELVAAMLLEAAILDKLGKSAEAEQLRQSAGVWDQATPEK